MKGYRSFQDRRCSSSTGNQAFSLIEVSLALLVIAIGLLSVLALIPGALQIQAETVELVDARLLSERVLADLRREPGTGGAKLVVDDTLVFYDALHHQVDASQAVLRAEIHSLPSLANAFPGTRPVAIRIIDHRNDQEIYSLRALVAK